MRQGVDLRAGVNNIFGKEPPVVDSLSLGIASNTEVSNVNAHPGSYDALGRTLFVAVMLKN